jgi:hypothetical protein
MAHPDLTEQYEQLRRDATGRSEPAVLGLGLALFLRRGMTAWMQAWSQCSDCAAFNTHSRPATPAAVPMDLSRADRYAVGRNHSQSSTGGNSMINSHEKVNASHLKRNAYLYIRQSTLRQVMENTESTIRQYDLRQRAVALDWPIERIIVIDTDLGQSAATAADRERFQRLVTEVSLEKAGIVLGLEVSRLARNSTDWHRLLENLCTHRYPDPR